ncbi:hypothetical protein V8D89_012133 [Ganoderma adspersum]
MLREWRVTYQEELAQLRAEEKKAMAKAVAKVKGKAKERAAAKAAVKAVMKAAYEKVELPCVSGIYRHYLEHIPNVILVGMFRAWVGRGYRLAALAGGVSSIFSGHILDAYGLPGDVHCSDLKLTDAMFNALDHCDFKLIDRDWGAWMGEFPSRDDVESLRPPVPYFDIQCALLGAPSSAPLSSPSSSDPSLPADAEREAADGLTGFQSRGNVRAQEELANRITIVTNFNPSVKTNTDRHHATKADQPADVDSLADQVSERTSLNHHNLSTLTISRKDVLFQAQDESILFLILGDMPAELRDPLERSIEICLGGTSEKPVLRDVRSPEEIAEFISIHFQWYARMCQKGMDAPKHVHSWFLKHEAVTKTNHTRKMLDHYEEYNALCVALERLKVHLGDVYDEIACYAESIPRCTPSPSHPFAGFVINLNIAAKAHRDGKDLKGCVVLPVGTFQGGELCLREPGLVVPLRLGDCGFFYSCDITHFNLPYTGTRASLVLHSDREGIQWVNDGMGSRGNMYFNNLCSK